MFAFKNQKIFYVRTCYARRCLSSCTEEVFIASAVRTPIGQLEGNLSSFSATQLGGLAIRAAVQRALIPFNLVDCVYMGVSCTAGLGQAPARQAAQIAGLPNNVCCTTFTGGPAVGLKAIIAAARELQLGEANVVVAGAMDSASNIPYYVKRRKIFFYDTGLDDGIKFDLGIGESNPRTKIPDSMNDEVVSRLEILPIRKQLERKQVIIEQDEPKSPINNYPEIHEGATAVVLINAEMATQLNLTPLARLSSFYSYSSQYFHGKISEASTMLQVYKIDASNMSVRTYYSKRNESTTAFTSTNLVAQILHNLLPEEKGTLLLNELYNQEATFLMFEKISSNSTESLPVLTLLTKTPCPLCDTVIEELETHFKNQYILKKVYIDQKEHVGFFRLFKLDIPVILLNGQFLCMHKLDTELLKRKLMEIPLLDCCDKVNQS